MTWRKRLTGFFELPYSEGRIYGLDIMRAAAIFFVVLLHSSYIVPHRLAVILKYLSLDGVSIFFVLSGFLIGGMLIRSMEEEPISLSSLLSFWLRRWFRILPAYYFVLILLLLLPAYYTRFAGWSEEVGYFYFFQNFNKQQPYFFPESWSISVEEWFYLLAPIGMFLLIGVIRWPVRRAVLVIAFIMISVSVAYRFYAFYSGAIHNRHDWDYFLRKEVMSGLDTIMMGVIGAYVFYYHRAFWSRYKVEFFIAGLIILFSMKVAGDALSAKSFFLCIPYFTFNAIGSLFLLPYLSQIKTGKGFLYKALTYLSLISYSIYLLNLSVVQGYLLRKIDFYDYSSYFFLSLRYALYWIFTVLGALILYKFIERPCMDFRKKINIGQ